MNSFFRKGFISSDGTESSGVQKAVCRNGKICWQEKEYAELSFIPRQETARTFFELKNVTIGINFHWERKEPQKFKGKLKIIVEKEQLDRNQRDSGRRIPYQRDFIGNECDSLIGTIESPCRHFRSWLLEKLKPKDGKGKNKELKTRNEEPAKPSSACNVSDIPPSIPGSQIIKWYGREAHTHFDVCADDHCPTLSGNYAGLNAASRRSSHRYQGRSADV